METYLRRAEEFLAGTARLIDRRRFDLVTGRGDGAGVLAALAGYRNADGGFGWSVEPDLRSPESQPAGALHAFEALAEAGTGGGFGGPLCDWLDTVTFSDGGLPFALPLTVPAGSSWVWTDADTTASSPHMTCAVAASAHWVAAVDPAVREHPWLARATAYCQERIAALTEVGHALEYRYMLLFLDAAHGAWPGAAAELRRLVGFLPESGVLPVAGGIEGESMRPLDLAPHPGPLRDTMPADLIAADLARLADGQQDDGGWRVDFAAGSPAAALEWRGYATVAAVRTLASAPRLDRRV
ncbi:hypothetical protein [Phytohabitans houttuyneae]|uniref:Uncharacterized protein n=1 Tax=Phytohabitans houttuyneae TaxID=1076126 RepID=A0A6V8KPR9_9ACTN|nr:hypothetical protein [Phytohabitans houttuyneae]GFJ84598.1 hypothetical protein Phou_087780 [Phytohabitans houttuyneae]